MNSSMARVVSVQSGANGDIAIVEVDAITVCARCAEGKGCGAGLLGQNQRRKILQATVASHLDVRAGDVVDITMEPRNLLRAAWLVYGLPLTIAVAMAGFGWWQTGSDTMAVTTAVAGLFVGLFYARRKLRTEACLREFTPTIVIHRGNTAAAN